MLYHHQHTFYVNWSNEDHFASNNKMIHCRYILSEHTRTSDTMCHYCWMHGAERYFPCIKQIDNWFRDSMMTDLLEDFAI